MQAHADERSGPGRSGALASLVVCWLVFTLVLALTLWEPVATGRWNHALHLFGLIALWATLTALLVRRLWPKSRLATLLEDPKQDRLERPVRNGGLVVLVVLLGAVALVLTCLGYGWN